MTLSQIGLGCIGVVCLGAFFVFCIGARLIWEVEHWEIDDE